MQQRNNHVHGKKCIMDVGWVGRVGVLADYREIPADLGDTGFSIVKLRQRVIQACFMLCQSHNFGVCIGSGWSGQSTPTFLPKSTILTSVLNSRSSVFIKPISSIMMPFFITVCGYYHPALFVSFLCCFSYDWCWNKGYSHENVVINLNWRLNTFTLPYVAGVHI